jgi:hypothetical protein
LATIHPELRETDRHASQRVLWPVGVNRGSRLGMAAAHWPT